MIRPSFARRVLQAHVIREQVALEDGQIGDQIDSEHLDLGSQSKNRRLHDCKPQNIAI